MLLEEANGIINGARQKEYGSPDASFKRIANMWSAFKGVPFSVHDVVNFLILLKVARNAQGPKWDTYVDIAGYAGCSELAGVVIPPPQPVTALDGKTDANPVMESLFESIFGQTPVSNPIADNHREPDNEVVIRTPLHIAKPGDGNSDDRQT